MGDYSCVPGEKHNLSGGIKLDGTNGITYNIIMDDRLIVLDTNVLLSALKSKNGSAYVLLNKIIAKEVKIAVSVPLILEYEGVLKKHVDKTVITDQDIENLIDYFCLIGVHVKIHYLWRPYLKDYFDDHVLETAININCNTIVTFNVRDFKRSENMGIRAVTPGMYLENLGENE